MRKVRPTPRDREIAAQAQANGGSLTAEEVAHTNRYDFVGTCGPLRRSVAWEAEILEGGGYRDPKTDRVYRRRPEDLIR